MQVGEVRVAEDVDFAKLKVLCVCHEGWTQQYCKNGTVVWTRVNDVSDFRMIKVCSTLKDVAATTMYDVLHDPQYRKTWDTHMIDGYEICCLNPNNDIGYYALKAPKPLKNRDFVIQRSWLDRGSEYYIVNHSVNHSSTPAKKGYVRGISYITGYYIIPLADKKGQQVGCEVTYVTQSDPKGRLPSWCVNRLTQLMAPKVMGRIQKACRGYASWKAKHDAHHKPWLHPEQMSLARLDPADIGSMTDTQHAEAIDETDVREDADAKGDDL